MQPFDAFALLAGCWDHSEGMSWSRVLPGFVINAALLVLMHFSTLPDAITRVSLSIPPSLVFPYARHALNQNPPLSGGIFKALWWFL